MLPLAPRTPPVSLPRVGPRRDSEGTEREEAQPVGPGHAVGPRWVALTQRRDWGTLEGGKQDPEQKGERMVLKPFSGR